MKKKSASRKSKKRSIKLHMYGIFDTKRKKMVKVSLDSSEIQMELALTNGLGDVLMECEFDVKLTL